MERYFNRKKYKELIVHIVNEAGHRPNFGSILLNKILVDCDLSAFKELGNPLTGQKIQHERMGPISAALVPVSREMEMEGALNIQWDTFCGEQQRRYAAKREADLSSFTEEERKLVADCIARWANLSGTKASQVSHERFGGWGFTNDGEEIPYETAWISLHPLSQADKDYALGLLAA